MKLASSAAVVWIQGARGNTESNIKLPGKTKRKIIYHNIVIDISANDLWLRQMEVNKLNVKSVSSLPKTITYNANF